MRRIEARVHGEVPERREDVWPFDIPALAQLLREGLDPGPATVLVGENGAGKSTLVEGSFGENFHGRSHGEGFRDLFTGPRFTQKFGLYVFDEPESALSFTSQLHLLGVLLELMERGDSQVLMATHSPVLASLPGATLLQLDEEGYRPVAWEDLDLVDHYRRFLERPERYLRHLR
ncbi:AAA family ATPase [Arsenicicoccus cauae]|uniref:AAA family ATPase n=1 Tax=Arsenicicoccus cauae TaxID=2663847 RepID=UPI00289DAD6F|nr:AAA family ATPase [Arsenicicoccus cauae]